MQSVCGVVCVCSVVYVRCMCVCMCVYSVCVCMRCVVCVCIYVWGVCIYVWCVCVREKTRGLYLTYLSSNWQTGPLGRRGLDLTRATDGG